MNRPPLCPPPHILPDPQKGAPPNRAPTERDAPFPEPSNYLLKFPVSGLPRFPQRAPTVRGVENSFPSNTLVNEPPIYVPHQHPYGKRSFISRANGLYIHLYLSGSPTRSPM